MKIETNENLLVNVSVMGSVCQPNFQGLPAEPYRLDSDGIPFLLPTWVSIVHNVSVGDSAFGWEADCIHRDLSEKKEVQDLVWKEIIKANEQTSTLEIRKFRMIPKELDHEDGELTATQKIKRNVLMEQFSELIEEMYT